MALAADAYALSNRYAKTIEVSKRIRWDIDRDVIKGRRIDTGSKFLPDGLSLVDRMDFLTLAEQRLLSQVQGRTYANMFGLVERFIGAKMLEISRRHWFGDQVALEAIVRFTDEELKHQELFRRVDALMAAEMPAGYRFTAEPNAVADAVLRASTWAVLALTCHIELFTQVHYRQSIEPQSDLSEIFRDIFLFHWKEESQHAIIDELEWVQEDGRLSPAERDRAVDDLIGLVGAVDGILQTQSKADTAYFAEVARWSAQAPERQRLADGLLRAYRWQYIVSGVRDARFAGLLSTMLSAPQMDRIQQALAPLFAFVDTPPAAA